MRNLFFIFSFTLSFSKVTCQNQLAPANFGVQFIDTVQLLLADNYIDSARIIPMKKNQNKDYYNNPFHKFKADKDSLAVKVLEKNGNSHSLLIPPLKSNRIYKLKIEYVGKENLFGAFRKMSNEGYSPERSTEWKKIIEREIERIKKSDTEFYNYYYYPTNKPLLAFQNVLKAHENIDFNNLTRDDTLKLKTLIFENLPSLKDHINLEVDKRITKDKIVTFCRWLKEKNVFDKDTSFEIIRLFGQIPDYKRLYDFYSKYLKAELVNHPEKYITHSDLEKLVEKSRLQEIYHIENNDKTKGPLPNYTIYIKEAIIDTREKIKTTIALKYETRFKRSLVPDFGYHVYLPTKSGISGGTPYIGVHLSLSPVNKDIPMILSRLSLAQRLSVHTGITLNTLKKENVREDFFSNYSLFFGGGLKLITQSTRLNFGGILYNELDPISGSTSLSAQPYVGISIDIEIGKWLREIFPSISKKFN